MDSNVSNSTCQRLLLRKETTTSSTCCGTISRHSSKSGEVSDEEEDIHPANEEFDPLGSPSLITEDPLGGGDFPSSPPAISDIGLYSLVRWSNYSGIRGYFRRVTDWLIQRVYGLIIRKIQRVCPLLFILVLIWWDLLQFGLTVRLVSPLLVPVLYDWVSWSYFKMVVFLNSYRHFLMSKKKLKMRWLWRLRSVWLISIQCLSDRLMMKKSILPYYDEYLKFISEEHPIPFPLSSHDHFWFQDTQSNPCQIVGMAVTEPIGIDEVRDLVNTRWLSNEPKLRAITSRLYGRRCWLPITLPIQDHVYSQSIDSYTNVHQVLSEIASTSLPSNKPRWRLILLNNDDSTDDETAAENFSCIVLQIHHGIADGTSIAYSMIHKLFDQPQTDTPTPHLHSPQPTNSHQQSQTSKAILSIVALTLWYCWNLLKTATYGLRIVIFWGIWCPNPPAIFQPFGKYDNCLLDRPKPTGIKYLSPPVMFDLDTMSAIRKGISKLTSGRVNPTINDLVICCLSTVVGKLRGGQMVREIQSKLKLSSQVVVHPTTTTIRHRYHHPTTPDPHSSVITDVTPSPIDYLINGISNVPFYKDIATPKSLSNKLYLTHTNTNQFFPKPLLPKKTSQSKQPYLHRYASSFDKYVQLCMPISVRTSLPSSMDNFTAPLLIRLPIVDPKADVNQIEHLQNIKSEIDYVKKKDFRWVFFLLVCLACKVFPECISSVLITRLNDKMQFLCTNVVGPSAMQTMNRRKVRSMQFWPPARGNVTAGIAVLSYYNQLSIFCSFDEAELSAVVPSKDIKSLSTRDRAAIAQLICNMMKEELISLAETTG